MSGMAIETARRKVAKGTVTTSGRLAVACRFNDETFDAINRLAHASNISFAAQVRVLVRGSLNRLAAQREAG